MPFAIAKTSSQIVAQAWTDVCTLNHAAQTGIGAWFNAVLKTGKKGTSGRLELRLVRTPPGGGVAVVDSTRNCVVSPYLAMVDREVSLIATVSMADTQDVIVQARWQGQETVTLTDARFMLST